jgi:protein SCO1/2
VLASGDPIAKALYQKYQNLRMPNVSLGGADVAAIVSYLETQSAAAQPQPHSH